MAKSDEKYEKNINYLLLCLEDERIRQAIRQLVGVVDTPAGAQNTDRAILQALKELEQQNNQLKQQKHQLEIQYNSLQSEKKMLEQRLAETKQQLAKAQCEQQNAEIKADRLQKELEYNNSWLQENLGEAYTLYQKRSVLSAPIRNLLKDIWNEDSFINFICGGANGEALAQLWEECRACIYNGREQEAEYLIKCFSYFLTLVNETAGAEVYRLLKVRVGGLYDDTTQEIDRKGRMQGRVEKVILPGYYNVANKRVVRKSIVILG